MMAPPLATTVKGYNKNVSYCWHKPAVDDDMQRDKDDKNYKQGRSADDTDHSTNGGAICINKNIMLF